MQKLASEYTYFPGDIPGFFGVLHTWGRTMNYHPHIHYIVPGGAFDHMTIAGMPHKKRSIFPFVSSRNW